MYECKECCLKFEYIRSFKIHVKREHQLTYKDYVVKHSYNNVHPVCACGCGEHVSWRNDSYFMTLVRGHVTQELRDAQANRRLGTRASSETKKKQSISSKHFWESERGKLIANERAHNLRKFHESERGQEWARQQSIRLKKFNATQEGKNIRRNVAELVQKKRITHPELFVSVGEKLRAYYASGDGQCFLTNRAKKLKSFYDSAAGKLVKEKAAKKIRDKLLLSREIYEKKLATAFSELIPVSDVPCYDDYVGYRRSFDDMFEVVCKEKYHHDTRKLINIINVPKCLVCNRTVSVAQVEIANFIRSVGKNVVLNERTIIAPKEIDVYVPDVSLAIEYNGLYWHSEFNRDNLHVDLKRSDLFKQNIKHFVVFEDEWRDKRAIVESMIMTRLAVVKTSIGARKCKLVTLHHDMRRDFFEKNHLDGDVKSKISFGLEFQGEIVSAISLRKPHHKSLYNSLEIARFATKLGYNVQGGLSKLISQCVKYAQSLNCKKLMTYVDMRIGDGHGYELAGMHYVRDTLHPRFWWTDFVNRYDRFKYKALNGKSQSEIATEAGVYQIFGAKNRVFELDIDC